MKANLDYLCLSSYRKGDTSDELFFLLEGKGRKKEIIKILDY